MATLKALVSFDMTALLGAFSDREAVRDEFEDGIELRYEDGSFQLYFFSSAGTLTEVQSYLTEEIHALTIRMSVPARTYASYAAADDATGLTTYIFRGNDTFESSEGTDVLLGFAGNDTFRNVDANDVIIGGAGTDAIVFDDGVTAVVLDDSFFAHNAEVESLVLAFDAIGHNVTLGLHSELAGITLVSAETLGAGSSVILDASERSLGITLRGGAGNDVLLGGEGIDTLAGGAGNDIYGINHPKDRIIEPARNGGSDTVLSSITYTLPGDLENLTLTGTADINATGNALQNVLTGNAGNNLLDGRGGADIMEGGAGDDVYVFDGTDIIEDSEGNDTVRLAYNVSKTVPATVSVNQFPGIENLVAVGTGRFDLVGDGAANSLTGNASNNTLTGGEGDDILDGGGGNDTMTGGKGNDTYFVDAAGDVVIEDEDGGDADRVKSSVTITLPANVENLDLLGNRAINATGNALDNEITGNAAANLIDGDAGADRMVGLGGNDTYVVDNVGDRVVEAPGGGIDLVRSWISLSLVADTDAWANIENITLLGVDALDATGNDLNNAITGNDADNVLIGLGGNDTLVGNGGNDRLDGGPGDDSMSGGMGDDTYVVDSIRDRITEPARNGGIDTVESSISYTLASTLENLTLTGDAHINATGNALANHLVGNSGDNILTGGGGADILEGGDGNDTYIYDGTDTIIETGDGNDTLVLAFNVSKTVAIRVSLADYPNIENLVAMGTGLFELEGNDLANQLVGNTFANLLIGHGGDDIYVVHSLTDVIVEEVDEGTDTVRSFVSFTALKPLPANVENLELMGSAALNGFGNALNNILIGNNGKNILDGGAGADRMEGRGGDDVYVVDHEDDIVVEETGGKAGGVDRVEAFVSYSLDANPDRAHIENLTLLGTANLDATGNDLANTLIGNAGDNVLTGLAGNDVLVGNAGNDILDGGTGDDTMSGGAGNDRYIVDSLRDKVNEAANAGEDTVESCVSFTLGANVEHLELTGSDNINATGNALANRLIGNAGNNRLDGKAGADYMEGGAGDDTYVIDNEGDTILEEEDGGIDTVEIGYSVSGVRRIVLGSDMFAHIENVTILGNGLFEIEGDDNDNVLVGNRYANVLIGGDGDDVLDGRAGADAMSGGAGNDIYYVDSAADQVTEEPGEGDQDEVRASISYTLGSNMENLTLLGSSKINGTGNELDNVIIGNGAANTLTGGAGADTLDGGGGNDVLIGGTGDDAYHVNVAADRVVEEAGAGFDTVVSSAPTYVLPANVEALVLAAGTANLNGTGNAADNTLIGNAGNNRLDGMAGADVMAGGAGNDTYVVDHFGDEVEEDEDAGIDTVESSVNYELPDNVENLLLVGTATHGEGNALDNVITGNAAQNFLFGWGGNDVLDGKAGADHMFGGEGDDVFYFDNPDDVANEYADEGIDTVRTNVTLNQLADNVENVELLGKAGIGATGNELDNAMAGNAGNNVLRGEAGADILLGLAGNDTLEGGDGDDMLDGGAGNDVMRGGAGNDAYFVDSTRDVVVELPGEGSEDRISATVSLTLPANVEILELLGAAALSGTGNAGNNIIHGNGGNNVLRGGDGDDELYGYGGNDALIGDAGADLLVGGLGDDVYTIDAFDTVVEAEGEGIDTIQAAVSVPLLFANVEKLVLLGSANLNGAGNELDNTLTGNAGNNVLEGGLGNDTLVGGAGNDTLDGGAGDDLMQGGAGNDIYYVDSVGDRVSEAAKAGTDEVRSTISYTLGADLENLTLLGADAIDGTGNSLANQLTGNAGNNVLDGGAGADTMAGGDGDDTYYVDNAGDKVTELANQGNDTVFSSVNHVLSDHVENLFLTGKAVQGTGNALENQITGNALANVLKGGGGNDVLDGGLGIDQLYGEAGDDSFVFDPLDSVVDGGTGIDTVRVTGSGVEILLVGISPFRGIEAFDLTGSGDNSLFVTGSAILGIADEIEGRHTLRVYGDEGDTLRVFEQGWVAGEDVEANGVTYHTYSLENAGLWVATDLTLVFS